MSRGAILLIVPGGTVMLVIPGIIWAAKYGLSLFAVMDKPLSARKALRFSSKITKGYKGRLVGVFLILILLIIWSVVSFGLLIQHLGTKLGLDSSLTLVTINVPKRAMFSGEAFDKVVTLRLDLVVFYLVNTLVIVPWMGATFAAAYDSLARDQKPLEDEGSSDTM